MAFIAVRESDRPVGLRSRSRAGPCRFPRLLVVMMLAALATASPADAGNVSLTLSGGIVFADASPDLFPVLGPQSVTLEVKAVGRRPVPWTLTLIADSDFRSGPDIIPISVVSWMAIPDPPYRSGTLSTVTPQLIGSGMTHEFTSVTFDFYMQNSWAYNAGNYSATATFTLSAP